MTRSIRWLTFSTAAMIVAWTSSGAEASFAYSISGTFGVDMGQSSGLAGGSFSGTYTSSGFSSYVDFDSYQVNLFNSAGGLVTTLTFLDPNNDGGNFDPTLDAPTGGLMDFYHFDTRTNLLTELQLEFQAPFNGNGTAIPYDLTQQYRSVLLYNRHNVEVASASSSLLVPTPPSVVLVGISGLLGLGWVRLRPRGAILAA